jgi:iron complex outermembrane receptor protein
MLIALLMVISTSAQFSIKGKITTGKQPVEGATISLQSGANEIYNLRSSTDGSYEIVHVRKQGSYTLTVSHVNYHSKIIAVNVASAVTTVDVELEESVLFLDPLEIKATRAAERAPFAKQTIAKEDLARANLGQDIPFLLNQAPSVVINSDAGNGIGYTGIRIRGSDASRINVTLNGIPYNDPESQGTFFVDLPDFASSLNSIQIQRGVGTSSNGGGSFGGTINLSTNEFNEKAYAELNNSFGSFNTWKHTLKAGTGLLNNHFTIDARMSKVSSDGYIDRAFSNMKSFYLSGAYISKRSTLRLNIFSGTEKTYQAWYGIDSATLRTNRTYNPAGTEKPGSPYDNQTDNYQQDHYQLFFNHGINSKWSFNTALFLVNGKGYYEQYRAQNKFSSYGLPDFVVGTTTLSKTDLVRQLWLKNAFYGQIASLQYKKAGTQLIFGGGWNIYDGNHFGKVTWATAGFPKDHKWYDLTALKKDANIYAKWQQKVTNSLELFADMQFRKVDYTMNGFRDNPSLTIDRRFNFFNPKAGLSYSKKGWQAYVSYALGQKEPNRDDFESGINSQPEPEKLHDFEAGIEKKFAGFSYSVNLFYMIYKDQLVLNGKINDVGAYTRVNVPNSYRRGIELQATKIFAAWLNASANLSLSENKIKHFTEYVDDYDHGGQLSIDHNNKTIAFSPAVVGALSINIIPCKFATAGLMSKFVSRQYLDNSESDSRSLNPYFVQDVRVIVSVPNKIFRKLDVIAQVNNVFNKIYEPNGYTFSYFYLNRLTTENYYFPMAGTNYLLGLNIHL